MRGGASPPTLPAGQSEKPPPGSPSNARRRLGHCYIFHVEKGHTPAATVALFRDGTKAKLGQVRGPCNAIVDKKIMQVLRKWVRQIYEVPSFERPHLTQVGGLDEFAIDDDIPF